MTPSNRWRRVDHWMRTFHLYTGLFLFPWMMVYAMSAMALNHGPWLREQLDLKPPEWKVERQLDFVPDDSFPQAAAQQAEAILQYLGMDGAHRIAGNPHPDQMIIFRISGSGNSRITWKRRTSKLLVEKQQPFSVLRLIHFLHFRNGYGQRYAAHLIWAVIVDAIGVSIVIWVVSGIYLWLRVPRRRLLGGICAVGGSLLFAGLVIALCR